MPEHKLEANSILYSVAGRQLLTDVYLSCKTGEIVGLLGRNGCGKSTLLQIIFGTLPVSNKHIRVDGNVYHAPYKHKNLIAYLPQHGFLPKNLPLQKIAALYFDDPGKRETITQHQLVQPHLNKRPDELSKGEQRFFELLLLLHLDVKFLLLDEPFSGLSPLYVELIQEMLQAHLSAKGFLITDHNYSSLMQISSRLILLTNGACRPVAHPDELVRWGYVPATAFS